MTELHEPVPRIRHNGPTRGTVWGHLGAGNVPGPTKEGATRGNVERDRAAGLDLARLDTEIADLVRVPSPVKPDFGPLGHGKRCGRERQS